MQIVTQKIRAFELFEFPASDLNALLKANSSTSTDVRIKIGEKFDWLMTIQEHDIRSPSFQLIEMTGNGPIEHPRSSQVNTYKGTIDGDESQWARLYVSDFKLGMSFLMDGIPYRIAPLSEYLTGHQFDNSFLLFKQEDVVISNSSCATESDHIPDDVNVSPDDTEDEVRFLQLATDVDYEFYLLFKDVGSGTPIGNVQAKIEEIVNEVDRRYFDAATLYIYNVTSHIWSTNIDPYSNTDEIVDLWNEFRTEWNASYKCNPRDAALLFSGKDFFGPIGVVKSHGVRSICGTYYTDCSEYFEQSYGVVADGNSPNLDATATHELGHIIGLQHYCGECGLMNPGNCTNPPCGSGDKPHEFSQYSIGRLKLLLDGQEKKCIGIETKYFDRDLCLLTNDILAGDVLIEENTVWTASTVPNGGFFNSLTLESGYSLTLMPDVALSFPVDGYVDVDQSTLINYGKLTGCEDQWDGVNVWGNGDLEPISTQGQYIGKRKSIIEKAKIGIENLNGPAVVKVDHAKFFNNQVSIKLSGVVNLVDPISSSLSASEIKFCEFKVDEPITGGFTSFIDLHKMNMTKYIQLRGNELYLSKEQALIPNYGITAKSSNIQAGFNKIDGLQYGINVEDGFAYIIGNNIINCKYGAFLRGVNVNNIFINQFHFGNMADAYLDENNKQIGIVLESAISGFTMSRNVFKGALGSPYITTIGTQCTDMGTNDYRISDNHYSELNIANAAHKLNGASNTGGLNEGGLRYLCNHLTLNTSDIYVTTDPTSIIKPAQGRFNFQFKSQPAYNEFSFLWPNAGWDYHNHYPSNTGGLQFVYYYDPDNTNTIPREGRYLNTIIQEADVKNDNYCYVKPTDPGPADPTKGELKKYYPTEAEKNSNRNRYFAAKDALQVSSIAKEQAAIQNNEPLLEQKSNESQYHLSEVNDAAYKGYLYSIIDSTGSDADSIPIWLERMHTFESEVSRADWHRQRGQVIVANEILNQLPNKFNLTGSYISDLDLYRNLLEINSQELDNAAFYQLEAAADSDHRLSSAYAKNVLSQHGFYYPPIDFELPVELQNAVQETSSETQLKVLVTPNPTNAYVRFDWSQFNVGSDVVIIELRDRVGNLLDLLSSSPGQYTMELSLETYQDGVIFYYLKHKEEPMDSGHIILSK